MVFDQLIDALAVGEGSGLARVCDEIAAVINRASANDQASATIRTLVMTLSRHHPAARSSPIAALARLATIADLIESGTLTPPFGFDLVKLSNGPSPETGRPRRRDPARPSMLPLAKEG